MKVRRKSKFTMPTRYILLILTGVCVVVLFISFTLNISGGPLNTVAGYVFVPMQRGINSVGTWISDKAENLKSVGEVLKENEELKAQVNQLTSDLNTIKLEQYELNNLRELWELDQKYPSYEKVGARVISRNGSNWFSTFLIDKGTNDGIAVDMNVIAGSGLVGIVVDVGPNFAKVRSIIDDTSNVSGATLTTSDYCIVNGNLQTMNERQVIEFSGLKKGENDIGTGEQIVTSNISDRYLPGILIGYIQDIQENSNSLTCSGTITPAVDFEHLDEVLVILQKKQAEEE